MDAVEAFAAATRMDHSGELEHEPQIVVQDLLCDLLHLCHQRGWSFGQLLADARETYAEELAEEKEERDGQ